MAFHVQNVPLCLFTLLVTEYIFKHITNSKALWSDNLEGYSPLIAELDSMEGITLIMEADVMHP